VCAFGCWPRRIRRDGNVCWRRRWGSVWIYDHQQDQRGGSALLGATVVGCLLVLARTRKPPCRELVCRCGGSVLNAIWLYNIPTGDSLSDYFRTVSSGLRHKGGTGTCSPLLFFLCSQCLEIRHGGMWIFLCGFAIVCAGVLAATSGKSIGDNRYDAALDGVGLFLNVIIASTTRAVTSWPLYSSPFLTILAIYLLAPIGVRARLFPGESWVWQAGVGRTGDSVPLLCA